MWLFVRYVKVRAHERGLLFQDRDFVRVLRPGRHVIVDPLFRVQVRVASVSDPATGAFAELASALLRPAI